MENHFEEIEEIARLLVRRRLQKLTDQEQSQLELWMDKSPGYRELAEQWMGDGYLTEDFKEFVLTDTDTPLAQIKLMIGKDRKKERPLRRLGYRLLIVSASVAAAVLIMIIVNSLNLSNPRVTSIPLITSQTPILFFDDGSQIVLDNSSIILDKGAILINRGDSTSEVLYPDAGMTKNKYSFMTISIPKGHIYELMLEDGTQIWMNAQTKLKYPVVFGSEAREVELDGEAFFKVAPDSSRPFRVLVEGQRVEVLGTEFNIRAYGEEKAVYTTLMEGIVEICTENAKLTLHPGCQSILMEGSLSVQEVNTANITGWREGLFIIEGQSLQRIMAMLARWYEFEAAYEDEELRNIIFNGVVPRYDELGRILDLLERTDEVCFDVRGDKVTVKRKNVKHGEIKNDSGKNAEL